MASTSTLHSYDITTFRQAYKTPVKWAGHSEDGVDIVLLTLRAENGAVGVAEAALRHKWHAATPRSFIATLEDVVLPALAGVDLENPVETGARLASVREHPLAKNLVDMACWDLRSALTGSPLWQTLGANSGSASLSYTITRAAPETMAAEAVQAIGEHGLKALKIKIGQGFETDSKALRAIRQAVGSEIEFFADANSAYNIEQIDELAAMLTEFGVRFLEDPCRLSPGQTFSRLVADCEIPVLVDDDCRGLRDGKLYLESGAKALSVKTMKSGISESLQLGKVAAQAGAKATVGLSASSELGAIYALALNNALPQTTRGIPCEESFFLNCGGFLTEALKVQNSAVQLPSTASLYELIDWEKVRHSSGLA